MPRYSQRSAPLLFILAFVSASELCAAPFVAGFVRGQQDTRHEVELGERLIGELSCRSCHANLTALGPIRDKQAPRLIEVGRRVRPEYLLAYLANPDHQKPGTTMPDVLARFNESERAERIDALAAFLNSTAAAPPRHRIMDARAAELGAKHFLDLGCAACHQPLGEKATLSSSVPLGRLSEKYSVDALAKFIADPLAVRPSGRMPALLLSPREAREIASHLLRDAAPEPNMLVELLPAVGGETWPGADATPMASATAVGFDIPNEWKLEPGAVLRYRGQLELERDGTYNFSIDSAAPLRISVSGSQPIVHAGEPRLKATEEKTQLKKGLIPFTVELRVTGRLAAPVIDILRQGALSRYGEEVPVALASLVVLPEETARTIAAAPAEQHQIAQGRQYFVTLGCASCHNWRDGKEQLKPQLSAPEIKAESIAGGCLAEKPAGAAPRYNLSSEQRAAMVAALKARFSPSKRVPIMTDEQWVIETFARFNCYACHQRGDLGGVEPVRDAWFHTTVQEMGDEGRLPPKLDGVGGKLTRSWLTKILNDGSHERPYMLTRMPKFGGDNVGHLAATLEKLDAVPASPMPTIAAPDYRVKSIGRRLVGTQGFSCVKCHNFNKLAAEGIPGIDMTIFARRLRPEWFLRYVRDPQAVRPGTRMPSAWPKTGQSILKSILEGDSNLQIASVWLYLKDGAAAAQPIGVGSQPIELVPLKEPIVYRNFLDNAGPRGIAVGLPEKVHYSFDADNLRLALLWHGAFMDAQRHWSARGSGTEKPLGDHILRLPAGVSFAELPDADAAWPEQTARERGDRFLGYRLDEQRRPVFRYQIGVARVEDSIQPSGEGEDVGLSRRLLLQRQTNNGAPSSRKLWLRVVTAEKIEPAGHGAYRIDGAWQVTIAGDCGSAVIRPAKSGKELLVPVSWREGRAEISEHFQW